jgi:uncharacterized protein
MLDIPKQVSNELSIARWQVDNTLAMVREGATVPFMARYRKERTGDLAEDVLRALLERHAYLVDLEARKEAILASIEAQGALTDGLRRRIEASLHKHEVEDLYLPFRPKRRTRATMAREKGLGPLADWIMTQNDAGAQRVALSEQATGFVDAAGGVTSPEDALQGASDILAEQVAEQADVRAFVRAHLLSQGTLASEISKKHPPGTTSFEMYRDYRVPVKRVPAHNLLAMLRGEAEGVLRLTLDFDEVPVLAYLERQVVKTRDAHLADFLRGMLKDAFRRLLKTPVIGEVRAEKKREADEASVATFAANLRELLLASPAGMRPAMGLDPGFRTGCKAAVLDATGRFLAHATVYPHQSPAQRDEAGRILRQLIDRYRVEIVAIGNGTGGRELDLFMTEVLAGMEAPPIKVMVSEAGASIYSASQVAADEFPELDLTIRGAISIGRRLQDPLAELVKIDPKSIGVGQYQHDVDQGLLKKKLEETVETCVNYVGVDLNTASKQLLGYVAGIQPSVAENIVRYRNEHGAFARREALLGVPRFGPKTFEQAAGFLRIRGGDHPLDDTGVHPERYDVVQAMAVDLGVPLERLTEQPALLAELDLRRYVSADVGEPTLRDIVRELEKPGRDPREAFRYASFRPDVQAVSDLQEGMMLEGVVTNVTNFGAFVDLGVHRDGLVHVSQLADRYVRDPHEVVKVGQVVQVRVVEVDARRNRISLSMRSEADGARAPSKGRGQRAS